ncbi:MAG: hypothetical protein ACO1NX_08415 [Chitinophagaceae bacterium]
MNNTLSTLAGENANRFPASGQPATGPADTPLVDMNEVVQYHLLSRRSLVEAMKVIIRYDALPQIAGSRQDVAALLSHVFNSILDNPPAGTKLFIYIRCEIDKSEIMDLSLPDGFQQYHVSVYTNIVADESWQLQQQPVLDEMKVLTQRLKGSFDHYSITKTGCLYQLMLPGKLK